MPERFTVKPLDTAIPAVSAEGISKSFLFRKQVVTVLDKISLQVREGEFVSIIGPSGCGKSTLLELLAGITIPDKGKLLLYGADITGKPGCFGYMPQKDLLFPWLSTMENILLPIRVIGLSMKKARAVAEQLLPVFGLERHREHLPYQLSGGLRQRVALMRTYMCGSRILLLDEPLANLDALTRTELQEWLKELVSRLKLTVILVTHDIDEAINLSHRIEVMGSHPGTFLQSISLEPDVAVDELKRQELKKQIRELLIAALAEVLTLFRTPL